MLVHSRLGKGNWPAARILHILGDQERCVGGDYAEASAKPHNLIDQLPVLTIESRLFEEISDSPRCPESWQELVRTSLGRKTLTVEGKRLFARSHLAAQPHRTPVRIALITSHDSELRSLEEIGEGAWVERLGLDTAQVQTQVGQDGVVDLGEEVRDFHFEVFVWLDVVAGTAIVGSQLVQQIRIHIVADAETEEPNARPISIGGVLQYLFHVGRPDCWKPVGYEHDHRGAFARLELFQRGDH